jgi:hypothetical protein
MWKMHIDDLTSPMQFIYSQDLITFAKLSQLQYRYTITSSTVGAVHNTGRATYNNETKELSCDTFYQYNGYPIDPGHFTGIYDSKNNSFAGDLFTSIKWFPSGFYDPEQSTFTLTRP